jgi:hypothetical protein
MREAVHDILEAGGTTIINFHSFGIQREKTDARERVIGFFVA